MALFRPTALAPETWTPEGTIVSQRYRALEGATVLAYTADTDRGTAYYAAACLGCVYREDRNSSQNPMSETEASEAANDHASACRAMPRGVPARPDDTEAARVIRTRLWRRRRTHSRPDSVHISDFNIDRVDLQRPTDWIKEQLAVLAASEPEFLTATSASSGTRFTVQPFPART